MGSLLVERKHDGVGRRIDIKPDNIAQLVDELRVVGELELVDAVRLETIVRQMGWTELALRRFVQGATYAAAPALAAGLKPKIAWSFA